MDVIGDTENRFGNSSDWIYCCNVELLRLLLEYEKVAWLTIFITNLLDGRLFCYSVKMVHCLLVAAGMHGALWSSLQLRGEIYRTSIQQEAEPVRLYK